MKMIQKTAFLSIAAGAAFLFTGCESYQNQSTTTKSTVGGAAIGAGAGALIDSNNRGRGALIGGAVGGLGGNIYGREKEEKRGY